MIKVLHITYDMRIGGTEMVIKNLIEGNDDPTIEMSIFCIEAPLGPWGEELQAAGIPITTQTRQPGFDTRLIGAIRRHIKQHKIDVLHCHQYTPWVYGALAAAFSKTKVIFTEHGRFYPDSKSWKRRFVNPLLLRVTDHITAISKATKQALVEYEYIPEARVSVVYNGIKALSKLPDIQTLKQELFIPHDHIVLGTVARLDPIKNQTMMVRAFADAVSIETNMTLLLVGGGELEAELQQLVESLGMQTHVKMLGYQPYPLPYLSMMDVFLLSSLSEGTSMTLLEAMSLGLPCIATDAGGNAEIVKHGQTGIITVNGDQADFTKAIISLATDASLRRTYGANGEKRFREYFTTTQMCKTYSSFYRD